MATIEIAGENLVIHLTGWDKLLALRSAVTVPLANVRNVVVRPPDAQYDHMKGLRLAGGFWPGKFAAGTFWVTGGVGAEQQAALEKLTGAYDDLAPAALAGDPDGHFAKARTDVERAIEAVKQGLALAKLPEAKRYLAFYDVHDPDRTIGIDVENQRIGRFVIEIEGETPEEAVARILGARGER